MYIHILLFLSLTKIQNFGDYDTMNFGITSKFLLLCPTCLTLFKMPFVFSPRSLHFNGFWKKNWDLREFLNCRDHTWAWDFFHRVGLYNISQNFGRGAGGSIFLGEFSDIIAFLLPNIFGKPRMGGMSSWWVHFQKGG